MRIFLSHSSHLKPLVRELRGFLPEHVNTWIDENDLIAGDPIERSLRQAIEAESDFVVVFVDEMAAKSEWVKKELGWAKDQEDRLARPFVLPVLIDNPVLGELSWLTERSCLSCQGFREADIHRLATELSSSLFAWLSRDLERLRHPVQDSGLSLLDEADKLLQSAAQQIRSIVLPYRKSNPLRVARLHERLAATNGIRVSSLNELDDLLFRLRQRKLLSGIVISGGAIYVEEEHLNWRSQEALAAKQAVADAVVDWIADGSVVFLDAGSTTIKICRNICRGVRFRQWKSITIATNSVPAASEFATTANDLGLEDLSPRLQVYLLGGRMRMNTSCIVDLGEDPAQLAVIADRLGGFDIAFVGTNGVWLPEGCTTTSPLEANGKRAALTNARRRVVLAESSKYNIRQDEVFATFDMQLEIATALDEHRNAVHEFATRLAATKSRVVFID